MNMPPLGSDQWKEMCREADKGIFGEEYLKKKGRAQTLMLEPEKTRLGQKASIKRRVLDAIFKDGLGPKAAAAKVYKDTGTYVNVSTAKNWVQHHRQNLRKAKENANAKP